MAFSAETYAILLKKIKAFLTGIGDVKAIPPNKLEFTNVNNGSKFIVTLPMNMTQNELDWLKLMSVNLLENPDTGKLEYKGVTIESTITENIKATVNCGAVSSGEIVVKDLNLTEFAKRLLQKDLAPRITILSTEDETLVYEKGIAINPELTIKVEKINATDGDIKTIVLSSTPADSTFDENVTPVDPNTNTLSKNVTISETQIYKVTATNSENRTANKSIKFTFVNPTYWGSVPEVLTVDTITESDIITKTRELIDIAGLQNKTDQKIFNVNMEKMFICYPSEYGDLTSIKDVNNGFQLITGFKKKEIDMTMTDGTIVKYNLWLADVRSRITNFPIDFTW